MDPRQAQFDWKIFESIFGQRLPFQPGELEKIVKDPGWVQNYVQDILSKSLPQAESILSQWGKDHTGQGGGFFDTTLRSDVFETHRSVIARVRIPANIDPYALRASAEPHLLKIEGLPDGKKMNIRLPAMVKTQGTRANFKNGVLEIRMTKEDYSGKMKPIHIEID